MFRVCLAARLIVRSRRFTTRAGMRRLADRFCRLEFGSRALAARRSFDERLLTDDFCAFAFFLSFDFAGAFWAIFGFEDLPFAAPLVVPGFAAFL